MRATVTVLLLLAATTASAQTPADGWSGQVQCVLATRGIGYQDDQTHTWVLSGAPTPRNDFRDYPATWTVSGRGTRTPISARASAAGAGDSWTHSGTEAGASITLFVPVGTTTMRISAGQRAVKALNGIRGTSAAAAFSGDAYEWRFRYIDVVNGAAQTSLSGSRTETRADLVGWRPPPGSTVTETCRWNLTRQGPAAAAGARGAAGGTTSASGTGTKPAGGGSATGAAAGASSGGGAAAGGAAAGTSTGTTSGPPTGTPGGTSTGTPGGTSAGATSATSTAIGNPDVIRQYTAVGRTPTPGTAVVFATLFDTSGGPLIGVPIADIHLVNAASEPVGIGPYVFGAAGDIVDPSALGVTFAFNGLSRVAFLDVPVGTFTLNVSSFVAGSVQIRSVPVTTTAGVAIVVELGASGTVTGTSATTPSRGSPSRIPTGVANPDITRQYAAIGRTPAPGTGVVFATLVDAAGAPLIGVPIADIHLLDQGSQPAVVWGPYVFGQVGDIVDNNTLSVTTSFGGRSRVAFLDVPVGRFTLSVNFSSGGKVVTFSAQVVTTAGGITLVQP